VIRCYMSVLFPLMGCSSSANSSAPTSIPSLETAISFDH